MKGDKEITGDLNHCANNSAGIQKCVNCPFFGDYTNCRDRLIVGANDLISRLTSRNERVKQANKKLRSKDVKDISQ